MAGSKRSQRKMEAKAKAYEKILEFVSEEEAAGNSDYLVMGYLSQKAKAENGPHLYGAVAALAINLSWQFVANFIIATSSTSQLSSDMKLRVAALCMALSFAFLFGSIFIVHVLHLSNRYEKEELFFKEHIMREKGLIE